MPWLTELFINEAKPALSRPGGSSGSSGSISIATSKDAMELLMEMNVVTPISTLDNKLLVDTKGRIYLL